MHSNDGPFSEPNQTYSDLVGAQTYSIAVAADGRVVTGAIRGSDGRPRNISYTGIRPRVGCRGGHASQPKNCPLRAAGSATL
eukprot:SAG31_NODE_1107_length_9877_cov_4.000102_3_plen_82_part_00